jgi:HK97 family phage major capsid protein
MKATVTVADGALAPYRSAERAIPVARERFRFRDLFPIETVTASPVQYRRILTGSAAADTVAEGDFKPEADVAVELIEAPVRKVAVFLPVTDEAREDGGEGFVRELVDDLVADLIGAENRQLIAGNGTAPNLTGLLAVTGLQTAARNAAGGETNLDALLRACTMLRVNAYSAPTEIVMHPMNWSSVRLSKAAGSGDYLLGSPLTAGQPTIDGARVSLTTDVPVGTALVMNAAEVGKVYLRSDVRVDSGVTGDMFQRNVSALRAETRLAFGVRRPASAVTVTALT